MVGGGWETLDMVVRYTGAVKFEDSPKVYEGRWRVVGVDGGMHPVLTGGLDKL